MLGTFKNGRFEEFFHARTLKPQDLRDPATSKQIAKRMRELHEGIELLEEERDAGPFVWRNWDSWLERCEKIVTHLDQQVVTGKSDSDASVEDVTKRGLVCGTDWKLFKRTVGKYRAWLDEQYGGADRLREQLVFAHNDVSTAKL
jgi:choline kinase